MRAEQLHALGTGVRTALEALWREHGGDWLSPAVLDGATDARELVELEDALLPLLSGPDELLACHRWLTSDFLAPAPAGRVTPPPERSGAVRTGPRATSADHASGAAREPASDAAKAPGAVAAHPPESAEVRPGAPERGSTGGQPGTRSIAELAALVAARGDLLSPEARASGAPRGASDDAPRGSAGAAEAEPAPATSPAPPVVGQADAIGGARRAGRTATGEAPPGRADRRSAEPGPGREPADVGADTVPDPGPNGARAGADSGSQADLGRDRPRHASPGEAAAPPRATADAAAEGDRAFDPWTDAPARGRLPFVAWPDEPGAGDGPAAAVPGRLEAPGRRGTEPRDVAPSVRLDGAEPVTPTDGERHGAPPAQRWDGSAALREDGAPAGASADRLAADRPAVPGVGGHRPGHAAGNGGAASTPAAVADAGRGGASGSASMFALLREIGPVRRPVAPPPDGRAGTGPERPAPAMPPGAGGPPGPAFDLAAQGNGHGVPPAIDAAPSRAPTSWGFGAQPRLAGVECGVPRAAAWSDAGVAELLRAVAREVQHEYRRYYGE